VGISDEAIASMEDLLSLTCGLEDRRRYGIPTDPGHEIIG